MSKRIDPDRLEQMARIVQKTYLEPLKPGAGADAVAIAAIRIVKHLHFDSTVEFLFPEEGA